MNAGMMAFLVGAVVLVRGAWAAEGNGGEKMMSGTDVAAVAKGSNAFGLAMYGELAGKGTGNLFFSPGSIDTALVMTYAGARGATATQMEKTLHLDAWHFDSLREKVNAAYGALIEKLNHPAEVDEWKRDAAGQMKSEKVPAYALVVANALWGQKGYGFRPEFTGLVAKDYGAGLNEVDFGAAEAARGVINGWVAEKTQEKIKELIPAGAITPTTRLVLTNAIYFKSDWAEKFSKRATKDGAFVVSAGKSVDVPMMTQTKGFGYGETEELQAVELPYRMNELSMVILLPKKADGLAGLEKKLTAENLEAWVKGMKQESVHVTLPKWKFSSEFSLGETLKGMGMVDAFDAEKADFSGMATHEGLCIGAVIHKAFVAVDEEGTEAAAATAVMMVGAARMAPVEPKEMKVDHPFVFLIRHNRTGEILFMGRVVDPKE